MAAIDPVGVGEYARRDTSHVDAVHAPHEGRIRPLRLAGAARAKALNWDDAAMADKTGRWRVADPTMTFILLRANRDLDGDRASCWVRIVSQLDSLDRHAGGDGAKRALRNPKTSVFSTPSTLQPASIPATSPTLPSSAGTAVSMNGNMLAHLDAAFDAIAVTRCRAIRRGRIAFDAQTLLAWTDLGDHEHDDRARAGGYGP